MPPALTAEQNQRTQTNYWGNEDKLLNKLLNKLGVGDDVMSYPDAGHSYMNNHNTFIFR